MFVCRQRYKYIYFFLIYPIKHFIHLILSFTLAIILVFAVAGVIVFRLIVLSIAIIRCNSSSFLIVYSV